MGAGVKQSERADPGLCGAATTLGSQNSSPPGRIAWDVGWAGKNPNGERHSGMELLMTGIS